MDLLPETMWILVRIFLQTLGLAALFTCAGQPLVCRLLPKGCDRPWPLSFRYGAGFFLGLAASLVLFVVLSRVVGSARLGLWISLALLAAASLAARTPGCSLRSHATLVAVLLVLVAVFTVTNATLWFQPCPSAPSPAPQLKTHFGSIHSGRYANYSIYVAIHDRIPFLAQNLGQSLLASMHLLLGADAPLAALMAWVPCALAALACLVFGYLRSCGLTTAWAIGGTFLALYCNLALSLVSFLVLDNGSPLGFSGYTDLFISAATLLLAAIAVQGALVETRPASRWSLALPAILGPVWCWCAPQNIVVGAAAAAGAGLVWARWDPVARWPVLRRLGAAAAVFGTAIVAGALQLGTFLPAAMREDIGAKEYLVPASVRVRPYVQYQTTYWTGAEAFPVRTDWGKLGLYETTYRSAKSLGLATVITRTLTLFESQLLASLRIYGFPLLGLVFMVWRLHRPPVPSVSQDEERLRGWFWLALSAFLVGYAIVFGLELGHIKWFLTRFMVPACILCLTGLVLAVAPPAGAVASKKRRLAWTLILVGACFGPLLEFSETFRRNWVRTAAVDPLPHRLNLLVQSQGPFVE